MSCSEAVWSFGVWLVWFVRWGHGSAQSWANLLPVAKQDLP